VNVPFATSLDSMADRQEQDRESLLAAFRNLSAFERLLLQLLSVIHEPTNRSTIVKCLLRAGIRGPDSLPSLAPHLKKFQRAGFLDEQFRCQAGIAEVISRSAVAEGRFESMAAAVREELPLAVHSGIRDRKFWRLFREIRIGIYCSDIQYIDNLLGLLASQDEEAIDQSLLIARICTNPFQPEWFVTLPASLQFYLLDHIISHSLRHLEHFSAVARYLAARAEADSRALEERLPFLRLWAGYLLWRGETAKVDALLSKHGELFAGSGLRGSVDFLLGRNRRAIENFEKDLEHLARISSQERHGFSGDSGFFFVLALCREHGLHYPRVRKLVKKARTRQLTGMLDHLFTVLELILLAQDGRVVEGERLYDRLAGEEHGIVRLFAALGRYWLDGEMDSGADGEALRMKLQPLHRQAESNGFQWLASQFADLLFFLGGTPGCKRAAPGSKCIGLLDLIRLDAPWRRSLKALQRVTRIEEEPGGGSSCEKKRLVWVIDCSGPEIVLAPKMQKANARGGWSKGRPVALSSLPAYANTRLDFLTEQDRRICGAIRREYISSRRVDFSFDLDKALPAMIGHPFLFAAEHAAIVPIEFVKGEPELLVNKEGDFFRISISRSLDEGGVTVIRETPGRFRIIEVTDKHRQIARIVGGKGLRVPLSSSEEVVTVVSTLSSFMTVHSSIAADAAACNGIGFEEIPVATRICMQLMPFGSGLKLKMFVRPFGAEGPYLKPGQGVENVMVEVKGRRLQARRDLAGEEENACAVEAACPTLALLDETDREWHLQEQEDCLQVLLELGRIKDLVTLEWPEGEKLAIVSSASFDRLQVRIHRKRDWFELSGNLELDEGQVVEMKRFIDMARRATGRFVPLGNGKFLALTREFHKRVESLLAILPTEEDHFSEKTGKAVAIHPLASSALEEFVKDVKKLEADRGWETQVRLLQEVREMRPEVPSTLRAKLRDYQYEGYIWLARLARLGVGACLADDMGLGKTLQALTIILGRARNGPTLVVAPTSVCMNWFTESVRFAPTLNVIIFGGKGRLKQIKSLKPFDVLVTSYTLLQQETKSLAPVEWETIVLDEAQAIKNMSTKRSRAAMVLRGRFRLLLTGTPIENHLGELWNLFNFINPGLLGSLESFNRSYAFPIERQQSHPARKRLRKLIRPFILRRLKSEVLEELPPRTEIVLQVEMSEDERAFYEALRREAVQKLKKVGQAQAYSVRVLAEIMRLRRACCNPCLIVPETPVQSSKLRLFGKLIDELLENRHKALVFSQFVGHLAIIREFLAEKDIEYRYLDGKMSVRERKMQVEKFQAGHGDLFLISLRAGGLGLNLTAADYVIHMDPWWNPAVEDQASDRAHRIGQERPVTIYRLVIKNTIEEKIVPLHPEKKDLADSLLEGSNLSAKISVNELLQLIMEN